ncbi:MAG: 50S ribosomal protein L35 [Bacilli bacterium]
MPKLKTHKGTKKVLNVRKGGTISIGRPGGRHNTGSKTRSANRKNRLGSELSKADFKRLKSII